MKWYHYLICIAMIIAGIFCSIQLVDLFSVKSVEVGQVNFATKNNYDEFSCFDISNMTETDDYVVYTSVSTYGAQDFDGSKNEYSVFFNDTPLDNLSITAGKISGQTILVFYDLDGNEVTTAKILFTIEYSANQTTVTATMTNENYSVSYFNSYAEINGAVLKVLTPIKENA